jgi:hypothetical protein
MLRPLWIVLFASFAAACGSGPRYAPGCPDEVPIDATPCSFGDGGSPSCEYRTHGGGSVLASCGISGTASSPTWSIFVVSSAFTGPPCPGSFAAATGSCDGTNLVCDYAEGRCACADNADSWICRRWSSVMSSVDGQPSETPCPVPRPLVGTACDVEGQTCDYGGFCQAPAVSLGLSLVCHQHYWDVVVCQE